MSPFYMFILTGCVSHDDAVPSVAEGKSVEQTDTHTEEMNLTVWLVRQCILVKGTYIYFCSAQVTFNTGTK